MALLYIKASALTDTQVEEWSKRGRKSENYNHTYHYEATVTVSTWYINKFQPHLREKQPSRGMSSYNL